MGNSHHFADVTKMVFMSLSERLNQPLDGLFSGVG